MENKLIFEKLPPEREQKNIVVAGACCSTCCCCSCCFVGGFVGLGYGVSATFNDPASTIVDKKSSEDKKIQTKDYSRTPILIFWIIMFFCVLFPFPFISSRIFKNIMIGFALYPFYAVASWMIVSVLISMGIFDLDIKKLHEEHLSKVIGANIKGYAIGFGISLLLLFLMPGVIFNLWKEVTA